MNSENKLKQNETVFIKFILVGMMNTAVGLSAIFLLLNVFHISYWMSTFGGNVIGAAVSFAFNRSFTFSSNASIRKSIPRFAAVVGVCYFVSFSGGEVAADFVYKMILQTYLMTQDMLAVLLGTGIYTVLNFLGQRYFVFRY
ncbi:GtrA family protein [Metabacillus idriensis]|uniref:GtrA family protein n=1 Tax=Metabacillus idriensis TaxID=324768 RepID=UPI001749F435|nr:GtrA family protein [Metabacillus idriensis]